MPCLYDVHAVHPIKNNTTKGIWRGTWLLNPMIPDNHPTVPDDRHIIPDNHPKIPDDHPIVPDNHPIIPDDRTKDGYDCTKNPDAPPDGRDKITKPPDNPRAVPEAPTNDRGDATDEWDVLNPDTHI